MSRIEKQRPPKLDDSKGAPSSYNLLILLLSLIFILIVVPITEQHSTSRFWLDVGLTGMLLAGAMVNRRYPPVFIPSLVMVCIALPVTWTTMWVNNTLLFVTSCIVVSLFFALTTSFILAAIFRRNVPHQQAIFGAISAYLMLGLTWAMLYLAIDRVEGESITFAVQSGAEHSVRFSQLVYFSFVTMSTLGYGDIVPETPLAQTFTWMQSVTGQFYMAVLVARLVAELPHSRWRQEQLLAVEGEETADVSSGSDSSGDESSNDESSGDEIS